MRRLVVACVLAVGCGRVGFDPFAATSPDATAPDSPTELPDAPPHLITFVQTDGSDSGTTATTENVTFDTVTAGDLLLLAFDYDFPGAAAVSATVTDSQGNAYAVAAAPPSEANYAQWLVYAIAGTTSIDTVTATLTSPCMNVIEMRLLEYRGITTVDPVDGAEADVGNSDPPGTITLSQSTSGPDELVVGFAVGHLAVIDAGSGFAVRSTFSGDLVEDEPAPTAGTYAVSFDQPTSGRWTFTTAAFR